MTQDTRAPVSSTSRRASASQGVRRRGPGLALGLLFGGGLLGCAAAGLFVVSAQPSQTSLAPALPRLVRHATSSRVVSAPDVRRFEGAGTGAASPASMAAIQRRENRIAAAQPVFSHLDGKRAAAVQPKPAAVQSHRFAPAGSSRWAAFVPAALPKPAAVSVVAEAQVAQSSVSGRSSPETATVKPADATVQVASLEAEHVEVALPDLAPEALDPPRSARDALEREIALAVPMPTARPFRQPAAAATPDLHRRSRTPAGLLAYARPDAGALEDEPDPAPQRTLPSSPALRAGTAVYDISASTVYLPNGERLEAHSGLGSLRDDVRYVHVKNRGPTPPHTYNLTMRESLFHGVAAIRLTPIGGERKIHNRNGLLAHTYMLGPRGDSNGCVSFKDYKRFLAAFKRGEIRRLVVVPSYKNPTSRIASLFGMGKR